jgi:hypothetical protein
MLHGAGTSHVLANNQLQKGLKPTQLSSFDVSASMRTHHFGFQHFYIYTHLPHDVTVYFSRCFSFQKYSSAFQFAFSFCENSTQTMAPSKFNSPPKGINNGRVRPSRVQQPSQPNGRPKGKMSYVPSPLAHIPHLPIHKQLAAAFFHLAASCARVVHAFDGTDVPVR